MTTHAATSDSWHIEPSGPLRGEIRVKGAKNAVSKHMVAAVLGTSPSRIGNAPESREVDITAQILRSVGVDVHLDGDLVQVAPSDEIKPEVPLSFSGINRIPILMLGPLLHRTGEAFVPLVGGDKIGRRPVDFHVNNLRAFGAEVEVRADGIWARAAGRLQGTQLELPNPSVMATESALLTAVLAEGRTVIRNAAVEPEVIELMLFLQRMGACIERRPDRRYVVEGVDRLHGAATTLQGDRLEAFSYLVAGLVTGGEVKVAGCHQDRLVTAINTLHRMGASFDITDETISATATALRPAAVHTDTHPAFMTDWQQPLVVLMTQADGMSVIHETIFEDRFVYVDALKSMGAEIELFDTCLGGPACRFADTSAVHSAVIRGVSKLTGAEVDTPDVRAGFSAVLAAAAAEGPSLLHGVEPIERGYHRPLELFERIGLRITRLPAGSAQG